MSDCRRRQPDPGGSAMEVFRGRGDLRGDDSRFAKCCRATLDRRGLDRDLAEPKRLTERMGAGVRHRQRQGADGRNRRQRPEHPDPGVGAVGSLALAPVNFEYLRIDTTVAAAISGSLPRPGHVVVYRGRCGWLQLFLSAADDRRDPDRCRLSRRLCDRSREQSGKPDVVMPPGASDGRFSSSRRLRRSPL